MTHPYQQKPPEAFWSRSVSANYDSAALARYPEPLIRPGDKAMSAGSCFAGNLVPYLEKHGFTYVRTEPVFPFQRHIPPENLNYARFSAAYGNIYTPRQMLQLLARALGRFAPVEDRWREDGAIIDPFRPGLRYAARSDREFDALTAQHLAATLAAFRQCDVLIFTLGLTEAWASKADGAVFPACPGTIAGAFDPQKHEFRNFSLAETVADLDRLLALLREINPKARLILTVSPVPLVATASESHVLSATIYSKSVLRVAAGELSAREGVFYFPAYEIVTGPQAPHNFFEADRRNVSKEAVDCVMRAFLSACGIEAESEAPAATAPAPRPAESAAESLSARVSAIECEEAAAELRR